MVCLWCRLFTCWSIWPSIMSMCELISMSVRMCDDYPDWLLMTLNGRMHVWLCAWLYESFVPVCVSIILLMCCFCCGCCLFCVFVYGVLMMLNLQDCGIFEDLPVHILYVFGVVLLKGGWGDCCPFWISVLCKTTWNIEVVFVKKKHMCDQIFQHVCNICYLSAGHGGCYYERNFWLGFNQIHCILVAIFLTMHLCRFIWLQTW